MIAAEFCRSPFNRPHPATLQSSTSARLLRPQADSFSPCLITSELSIANSQLQKQLQCYEWRKRTEFPIVKIHDYKTKRKEGYSTILSLRYQNYPIRLSQLRSIPLFKILYLLKEAIIGFERLYDRYGPFKVCKKMVALTQGNRCKVWLNENFEKNGYVAIKMEEKEFLQGIVRIFAQIGNQLKNTLHFFRELAQFSSFCQALAFIENYARENRVSIPTSCKVSDKELVIIETQPEPSFNPSLTMTRSPKFLSNVYLRGSLKPSARVAFEPIIAQAKQQQKLDGLNMKTSGDTATDVYGSNTHSQSNQGQKETFDESMIFGETKPQPIKSPEPFLQFSKSMKKHHLPFRKQLSEMTPVNSYFLSEPIRSIQPQPHFKSYRQVESQSQSEQANAQTMAAIFHKNKWEKSINGLFTQSSEMKHSTHHGQQSRKISTFPQKKLLLLQQVSKQIHESLINQQDSISMTMQI